MQLFILALILGVFAHDALGQAPVEPDMAWWQLLAWVVLPKIALAGAFVLQCRWTVGRLGSPRGRSALKWLHRTSGVYRYAALLLFANDLRLGALLALRGAMGGDWVLVDELLVMAPTLALLVAAWWGYYPVERAVRQATLIRRLDEGLPIHPMMSRGQYLLSQWRHQVALMLLPLMLMFGWIEAVMLLTGRYAELGVLDASNLALTQGIMVLAGTACVFLFAPLMIRWMWDTVPLPEGDLRERLLSMCRLHDVGVRELLLWRTFGGLINAAVMGLVAPLRFILLSDGLIEMLRGKEVEAVMAHEIAHVRKGHMFWLVVAAIGLMLALGEAWARAMDVIVSHYGLLDGAAWGATLGPYISDPQLHEIVAAVGTIGCWVFGFGWVSRRFERQADTFAVQHMARIGLYEQQGEADQAGDQDGAPAGAYGIGAFGRDAAYGGAAARFASANGEAEQPWMDGGQTAVATAGDRPARAADQSDGRIDARSVGLMSRALGQVAAFNHVPVGRRSWRHGSIQWRQDYLRSLIGQPIERLPIDRQVAAIKLASAALIAAVIGLALLPI